MTTVPNIYRESRRIEPSSAGISRLRCCTVVLCDPSWTFYRVLRIITVPRGSIQRKKVAYCRNAETADPVSVGLSRGGGSRNFIVYYCHGFKNRHVEAFFASVLWHRKFLTFGQMNVNKGPGRVQSTAKGFAYSPDAAPPVKRRDIRPGDSL